MPSILHQALLLAVWGTGSLPPGASWSVGEDNAGKDRRFIRWFTLVFTETAVQYRSSGTDGFFLAGCMRSELSLGKHWETRPTEDLKSSNV